MPNQQIFNTYRGKKLPKTNIINEAGGTAYKFEAKEALAQYASVGCFGDTFYVSAEDQLENITKLLKGVNLEFVAKCAVYSRESGYLKDMPAFLLAYLTTQGQEGLSLAENIFDRVVTNGRILRNFVQIIRSGQLDRKSFGTAIKRMINTWLNTRNSDALFNDSVGQSPSLSDVIKMTHPKPLTEAKRALFGYLIGQEPSFMHLPDRVCAYEEYKTLEDRSEVMPPNVPFQLLSSLNLGKTEWTQIAKNAKWQMTRMNLNTFLRHGVFEDKEMVKLISQRLKDPENVKAAKVFPYQLLVAYLNANNEVPFAIREALQDAMEIAIDNVLTLNGNVVVCPDVSYSMNGAVTGKHGKKVSSKVRCVDVAALLSAAILRKNPEVTILPFADRLYQMKLNPRDSVMTHTQQISNLLGGGTACSLPVRYLVENHKKIDYLIYVSDNQSWLDVNHSYGNHRQITETLNYWTQLKKVNPNAKMVCIDINPYETTQTPNREDILNVGGFSDSVFDIMSSFFENGFQGSNFVSRIEKIKI